jgi:hypothetical protein
MRGEDVVDADYVEVSLSSGDAKAQAKTKPEVDPDLLSVLSGKDQRERKSWREPGGAVFWSIGAAAVLLAFWVSGGHSLVRETMAASAERIEPHMRVSSVRTRAHLVEGEQALLVEGEVANEGRGAGHMPGLTIAVVANSGVSRSYRLAATDASIAPGKREGFSSRLDSPMDGVKTVSVTLNAQE